MLPVQGASQLGSGGRIAGCEITRKMSERLKSVLNGSKLLRVRGKLQIDPESRAVVHVVVESAEPLPLELTGTVDIPTMSRDFH